MSGEGGFGVLDDPVRFDLIGPQNWRTQRRPNPIWAERKAWVVWEVSTVKMKRSAPIPCEALWGERVHAASKERL